MKTLQETQLLRIEHLLLGTVKNILKQKEKFTTVTRTFDKEGNNKSETEKQIACMKRQLLNKP